MNAPLGEHLKFLEKEETSVRFRGNFQASAAAARLWQAFTAAMALETKLPAWIRTMPGMSGRKYRYLINNLVALTADARYLEVGSWAGSTACAAMYGNHVTAVCIDNWSEFGGPKEAFHSNVGRVLSEGIRFSFIECDFRAIDFKSIGKFNLYMFDGPHDEQDQYDGIALAAPALDEDFTLIVDDYNHAKVENGTARALAALGVQIVAWIEIKTSQIGQQPQIAFQYSDWHDGYFIAACRRAPAAA